jgi:hypothetical protein
MSEKNKKMLLFIGAVASSVYFTYMGLLMSGITNVVWVLVILMFGEGIFFFEKNKESSSYTVPAWLFHLLCGGLVLLIAFLRGDVSGFEWAEKVDGQFVMHWEPAENWWLLVGLLVVRLTLLQAIYVKKSKK